MDEEKRKTLENNKNKNKTATPSLNKLIIAKNKIKAVALIEKNLKSNNNNLKITTEKNDIINSTERNTLSYSKKDNSIGFSDIKKRKTYISSHKNNIGFKKQLNNLDVNKFELNSQDSKINKIPPSADNNIGLVSLTTGNIDNSINQVNLGENKNLTNNNLLNSLPHINTQNSINYLSSNPSDSNQIKVVVRFRPMNDAENEMLIKKIGFKSADFKSEDTVCILNSFNSSQTFTFDRVYDDKSNQQSIYEETAEPLIEEILKGYNGTIFTYGQSGSGKTYTMYGTDLVDEDNQGIIPRVINKIFEFINAEENKEIKFELKFSMLEIYQEGLYDLLNPETKSSDLRIKEHNKKGIYIENLSEVYISSQEEFLILIHEAEKFRIVKETGLNKCSSRSHLLFQLQITQKLPDDTERRGLLNLIDLAGSEKVSKTHAIGETLNEAKKINASLSVLGKVISILAANNGEYVPYRESKLTRILKDSIGGNSKTILVVNCSTHSYNSDETIYTLNFAKRAKKIKNKVKINIKHSVDQLESIIEMLSNKLKYANEEILRLNGKNVTSPIKSPSLITHSEENQINSKSLENSILKNLGVSTNMYTKIDNISELLIIKKDEEIISLNDKVEALQLENKNLQDKLEGLNCENNLDLNLEKIEKSLKSNLEELKEITSLNKKDEIDLIKDRMKDTIKYYEELEKNYMFLFKNITEFKDLEFEKKLNIIISENYSEFIKNENKKNEKFSDNKIYENQKNQDEILQNCSKEKTVKKNSVKKDQNKFKDTSVYEKDINEKTTNLVERGNMKKKTIKSENKNIHVKIFQEYKTNFITEENENKINIKNDEVISKIIKNQRNILNKINPTDEKIELECFKYKDNSTIPDLVTLINNINKNKEIEDIDFISNDNINTNVYDFNFKSNDLFNKVLMRINSKNKANYSDCIVLSYKNIFSMSKFYSINILDEFLKKKENFTLQLIQKSLENLDRTNKLFNNTENDVNESYIERKGNYLKPLDSEFTLNRYKFNDLTDNYNNKEYRKLPSYKSSNRKDNIIYDYSKISDENLKFDKKNCELFLKMKTCVIKLMLKTIYYENINFYLMNKLSLDLNIFNFESKYRDQLSMKLENITDSFNKYLEVLEELKKTKFRNNNEDLNILPNNNKLSIIEDDLLNKNSPNVNKFKILNSLQVKNKQFNRESTIKSELFNNQNTIQPLSLQYKISKPNANIIKNITRKSTNVLNNLGFGFGPKKIAYDSQGFNQMNICSICNNHYHARKSMIEGNNLETDDKNINEQEEFVINNPIDNTNENILINRKVLKNSDQINDSDVTFEKSSKFSKFALNQNENKDKTPNLSNSKNIIQEININNDYLKRKKSILQNKEYFENDIYNFKNKWEALRQSVISTGSNNKLIIINDDFKELKLAKKESALYKSCFESITTDYKNLKSLNKNFEVLINKNSENFKNLNEKEIEKFSKSLDTYKDLYSKELKIKDYKINQLSRLIDEILGNNENFSQIIKKSKI